MVNTLQPPVIPPPDLNAFKEILDSFFMSLMNAPVELFQTGEALPNAVSNALSSEGNLFQFANKMAADVVTKSGEIMFRPPQPPQ